MKISLEWLSEYLPGPLTAEAAGKALTHGGLPVEVSSDMAMTPSSTWKSPAIAAIVFPCWRRPRAGGAARSRFSGRAARSTESANSAAGRIAVGIEATDLCPHYTARVLRNVKIGPSPTWLARRLEAVGLRPINNVVDVTNYVMFELGQPLHAFDWTAQGGQIIVRQARGEKLVSIDGRERRLSREMLVIADAKNPVALAGVMGGRDSEVSNSTTSVLLESARFDPLSVRKTARHLAMKSDSSYRFERGIDPLLPEQRKPAGGASSLRS